MTDDPMRQPTYHHVGTGRTRSDYWCGRCGGWYGVPHYDFTHDDSRFKHTDGCCCGRCLTPERRKAEGVVMVHASYLETWDRTNPDRRWLLPQGIA